MAHTMQTAKAQKARRRLAALEAELEAAREEYREAATEGCRPWRSTGMAHPREVELIEARGRKLAERVEKGRRLIAARASGEHEEGGEAV